jgi:hypothetical protein
MCDAAPGMEMPGRSGLLSNITVALATMCVRRPNAQNQRLTTTQALHITASSTLCYMASIVHALVTVPFSLTTAGITLLLLLLQV